jgi:hypothetical protein
VPGVYDRYEYYSKKTAAFERLARIVGEIVST